MKRYLLLYLLAAGIFLGHYAVSGHAVYGDGIDYWVYLHSWYFDQDEDFNNEYRHNYSPLYNNNFPDYEFREVVKTNITVTGKTNNFHPPGTAVILFPAYVVADWIGGLTGTLRNGYSNIYQITTGLWAVGLAVLGARICEAVAHRITGLRKEARSAAMVIFLASPLLYYGSYDVLNSHFASFLVSAIFWLVILGDRAHKWLYLGLIVGLAGLVRLQDLLLVIPAMLVTRKRDWLGMGVMAGIVMFPLLWQWQEMYGRLYPESYFIRWTGGIWQLGSWFHPINGLFLRTPILLICLAALPKLWKKIGPILVFFAIQTAMITMQGGWSAAAYGGRMYISTLPMFVVLLTLLIKKLPKLLLWGLVALNFVSIGSFVLFEKEVNSGKKRGLEEHTIQKIESGLRRLGWWWSKQAEKSNADTRH